MNRLILIVVVATCVVSTPALSRTETEKLSLHARYSSLLSEVVRDGRVDCAGLKKKEARLDRYLKALAAAKIVSMTRNEKLAFWINAYNAFTLKLILDNYPAVKSIRDLDEPWASKSWKAASGTYSLDDIEHTILRKVLKEPRIHFALVCASISCPDLLPKAFLPKKLDEQLDAATRAFLADTSKGFEIVGKKDGQFTIRLSRLFEWFSGDFKKAAGSVAKFVTPYLPEADRKRMERHVDDLEIVYFEYDWKLNGK